MKTVRKKLKPEDLILICDSREQMPLNLDPFKTIKGTLTTGDYSVSGLTHRVCAERKSLVDLITCVGKERERFDREIKRMLAYESRLIIVEGSIDVIRLKQYRGETNPNSILSSVMGWMALGVPIHFAGDREAASDMLKRFLFIAAQRAWSECYDFIEQTATIQAS
jgi:ERCC4-type nuclease